jgi:hypothetical protein
LARRTRHWTPLFGPHRWEAHFSDGCSRLPQGRSRTTGGGRPLCRAIASSRRATRAALAACAASTCARTSSRRCAARARQAGGSCRATRRPSPPATPGTRCTRPPAGTCTSAGPSTVNHCSPCIARAASPANRITKLRNYARVAFPPVPPVRLLNHGKTHAGSRQLHPSRPGCPAPGPGVCLRTTFWSAVRVAFPAQHPRLWESV